MPNFDGTGPLGKGSRTGRQMGKCGSAKPLAGRGLRPRGRGIARCQERGFGRKILEVESE